MPNTNYLKFRIGNREIEVSGISELPVSIDYSLEDPENFEQKRSSEAFGITLPATQNNSQTFNSPTNPNVEDLTEDEFFTSHQPCVIEANGVEILKGKAFLVEATHTDRPETIKINCYGNNADWLIDLKEATLLDFVNPSIFEFTAQTIEDSWSFDGYSEAYDFVYAPVRYGKVLGESDAAATLFDMKPAISIYWFLYRALRSQGYKIASAFMDSAYFRRLVMPWTFGDFLFADDDVQKPYLFRRLCTRQENSNLLAVGWNNWVSPNGSTPGLATKILWDDASSLSSSTVEGGYEGTPGISEWVPSYQLKYKYPANSILGYIAANFSLKVFYYVYINTSDSSRHWDLYVHWFINGTQVAQDTLFSYNGGDDTQTGTAYLNKRLNLSPGDVVTCQLRVEANSPGNNGWRWAIGNTAATAANNGEPVSSFELINFEKAIGSPVQFHNYPIFKKYKWLDLLRGVIDAFNLSIQTDPITKTVYIEPTHDFYTGANPTAKQQGYTGKGTIDWREKQDLSKESTLQLYSDSEREFGFKFKDDSNDGGKNILEKRFSVELGSSRYLFPDRFKTGKKEYTNRFFTPVVHVGFSNWKTITGTTPQLIALIPENISNTSKNADATIFEPKLAYYKGNVTGVGGWKWQPNPYNAGTRVSLTSLPYLFAVNYQAGGEQDPILTYCDQRIGGQRGHGLMRRFFLQRLAIMRHGRLYQTHVKLDMNDITNWLHREWVILAGKKYSLIGIEKFQPLKDETTKCTLWQWEPISLKDDAAVFPSNASVMDASVMGTGAVLTSSDLAYAQSLILSTDIPQ